MFANLVIRFIGNISGFEVSTSKCSWLRRQRAPKIDQFTALTYRQRQIFFHFQIVPRKRIFANARISLRGMDKIVVANCFFGIIPEKWVFALMKTHLLRRNEIAKLDLILYINYKSVIFWSGLDSLEVKPPVFRLKVPGSIPARGILVNVWRSLFIFHFWPSVIAVRNIPY